MDRYDSVLRRSARVLASAVALAASSAVAATPGFREDFTSGTGGFGGGGSMVARVASGGVGGASDAYLSISNATPAFLGSFSTAAQLVGDLPASGVTGFSFWLRDTGANDNLEIHVGVGAPFSNFWLSIPGCVPPDGSWQKFTVDVTDSSQWVQIIVAGTFQDALATSTRLLFRHDTPPLEQNPPMIAADFGLDRIVVLPAAASVPAVSAPGRAALALLLLALAGLGLRGGSRLRVSWRQFSTGENP